ncbi:hypothetical protein Q3G72_018171 [Acer saccharum]|nr:hypothetical protein Q3G72_018171 [Acer saccharum]
MENKPEEAPVDGQASYTPDARALTESAGSAQVWAHELKELIGHTTGTWLDEQIIEQWFEGYARQVTAATYRSALFQIANTTLPSTIAGDGAMLLLKLRDDLAAGLPGERLAVEGGAGRRDRQAGRRVHAAGTGPQHQPGEAQRCAGKGSLMATQQYRARYVELELVSRPLTASENAEVVVRTVDGEDLWMLADDFDHFYVPVHSVAVDLSEQFD